MSTPVVHRSNGATTLCGRSLDSVSVYNELPDFVTCKACLKVTPGEPIESERVELDRNIEFVKTIEADVDAARKVRPPMNRAEKRAARRNLQAKGIDPDVMVVRYDLTLPMLQAALDKTADDPESHWSDLVMVHLQAGIRELEAEGGNVQELTVITLGSHPRNPGGISIEVKTREPHK